MKLSVLILLGAVSVQLNAAIPKGQPSRTPSEEKAIMALKLPFKNRVSTLRLQGQRGFDALQSIAFDPSQPMFLRWRAITSISNVHPSKAYPVLEKAMQDSKWFMRNAAILAMPAISKVDAVKWSIKLLDDRALVVRTAAVQTLEKLKIKSAEEVLWTKLQSSENYFRGKSLWVRKHIARALAQIAGPSSMYRFVKLLNDPDERVQRQAIFALEKLTGKKLSRHSDPVSKQRLAWISWWDKK